MDPAVSLDFPERATASMEPELLKLSLEACPEAAYWFGTDNRLIYVNNACCKALGYTREEMVGMSLFTINPALTGDDVERHWNLLRTRGSNSGETVCRRKNGTSFPVELLSSYVQLEGLEICFGFAIEISRRKENEATLRESEERYRVLFESSRDGFVLLKPRNRQLLSCNKAALGIFGCNDVSELAESFWELSPENQPDGRNSSEKAGEMIEIAMKNGMHSFEWLHRRKNGNEFPASILLRRVALAECDIIQVTVRDTTEQKRSEELMRVHHNLARALGTVCSLDEGLRLCLGMALKVSMMDCGGIYLRDDATGKLTLAYHEGFPASFLERVPKLRMQEITARTVAEGKPVYTDIHKLGMMANEMGCRKMHRAAAVIPFMDEGQVSGCLNLASHSLPEVPPFARGILEIIAAQIGVGIKRLQMEEANKKAAHALRESEERYRRLLSSITGYVYTVDIEEGECVSTRHGEGCIAVTGYRPDDYAQDKDLWIAMVVEEDRSRVLHAIDYLLREKSSVSLEHHIKRKDGAVRWISATLVPHIDPSGMLISYDGLISDITSRKEKEQTGEQEHRQLLLADKMASLGVLVSGVAHEINNPNNYMMLNAKILSKAWNEILPILDVQFGKKPEADLAGLPYLEARKLLPGIMKGMLDGTNRIKQIVDSLRSYSRTDTSKLRQDVDVNKAVESALTLVSSLIRKTTDFLKVQRGDSLPTIKGSQQQIEQVTINLLTNACHALRNRTDRIEVRTFFDESAVILQVIDTGVGIAPEDILKITEPFFTTRRESGGTGLGLSVSSNIVKNHGGSIAFASEPGKGTTVTVRLPRAIK
jgi:PAS domain S-box-containing protein